MDKVKINKMAEKDEVQFKKKKQEKQTSFACKRLWITAKCYSSCFGCLLFFVVVVVLKFIGVMGLSVLDCGTPYR